ncbi:MAG: hypothetical protein ACLTXL_02130 [Clostridia bacterium]
MTVCVRLAKVCHTLVLLMSKLAPLAIVVPLITLVCVFFVV